MPSCFCRNLQTDVAHALISSVAVSLFHVAPSIPIKNTDEASESLAERVSDVNDFESVDSTESGVWPARVGHCKPVGQKPKRTVDVRVCLNFLASGLL